MHIEADIFFASHAPTTRSSKCNSPFSELKRLSNLWARAAQCLISGFSPRGFSSYNKLQQKSKIAWSTSLSGAKSEKKPANIHLLIIAIKKTSSAAMWNIVYTKMNLLGVVRHRCIIDSFVASCICFRHCPTSQPVQQKLRFKKGKNNNNMMATSRWNAKIDYCIKTSTSCASSRVFDGKKVSWKDMQLGCHE